MSTQQNPDINIIDRASSDYPSTLAQIANPPQTLYVKGNIEAVNNIGVAIVGTRNMSQAGEVIARRISAYIASKGYTIVSGLALGIDAAAHEGALSVGGKTVCVLAGGLHSATPKQNAGLADRILQTGGAWVSEQPLGVNATRNMFVPRNRIQVGLSACSIIIESEIKSGTMTHAKFCVQEKNPLFAVVPEYDSNPLTLVCNGPKMMVDTMGAIPISTKEDYPLILEKLPLL